MRRRYALALSGIAAVVIATFAVLAYMNSPNSPPPEVVLDYNGNPHSGILYVSCWPTPPANGTCPDAINIKLFPPLATLVTRNSSVTFQVLGHTSPSRVTVAIWTAGNGGSLLLGIKKDVTGPLPINYQSGTYYLSVFASWNDGRAVGYTFEITIPS